MRTEFGAQRTVCGCDDCQTNCRNMPGYLIPADLDRLIPPCLDPLKWAESYLLASPGALVSRGGEQFRIPTLVPAVKVDRSCINLTMDGRCLIHENAPFGCAFFDCKTSDSKWQRLAAQGLGEVQRAWHTDSLYRRIWVHLASIGRKQQGPEVLRKRFE